MNKTIMTVDDSTSFRQMMNFTLSNAGYDVLEAKDGTDALMKINGKKIDMMFVDLNMPEMDGVELIRAIRSNPLHKFIPILMLTSESEALKKQEGRSAGATGWIVKPFDPEKLLLVVKKVLE